MYSLVTAGIKVAVKPDFLEIIRNQGKQEYAFSYQVSIENQSNSHIQLLSRYWKIFDADGSQRIVEGEGVVGHQPLFRPGDSFVYESWCPLSAPIGYMEGYYIFINKDTQQKIEVKIPRFELMTSFLMN